MFVFGYVKIVFNFLQVFMVGEFVFQVKKKELETYKIIELII